MKSLKKIISASSTPVWANFVEDGLLKVWGKPLANELNKNLSASPTRCMFLCLLQPFWRRSFTAVEKTEGWILLQWRTSEAHESHLPSQVFSKFFSEAILTVSIGENFSFPASAEDV